MAMVTGKKIDLLQMQREFIDEYGKDNCDFDSLKRVAMVAFDRKRDNGDICGYWNGHAVFRDRDSTSIITEGEAWFCELKQHHNNSYIAKPLMKVDAEFLYTLRKDQLDELSRTVWDNLKDVIEPELRPFYEGHIESRSKEIAERMIAEIRSENETMADRISTLESESIAKDGRISTLESEALAKEETINGLALTIEDKDADINVLNERIGSLKAELERIRSEYEVATRELEKERHRAVQYNVRPTSDTVIRVDRNTLYSSRFQDGRYKVRFSSDRRRMRITPDTEGEIECTNNQLRIDGLFRISPFTAPEEILFEEKDGVLEARLC